MGAIASKYDQPISSPVSRTLVPKESKIRLNTEKRSSKPEQLSLKENDTSSTSSLSTSFELDCDIQSRLDKIKYSLSSSGLEEKAIGEVSTLVASKLSVSGNSGHNSKLGSTFLENIESEKLEEENGIMEVSYFTLFSTDNSDGESDC